MTTPLGAFGVYSVERSPGSKAIATGDGGHRTVIAAVHLSGPTGSPTLASGTSTTS
jgi:hypothetical protein